MDHLQNRVEKANVEDLINICEQLSEECRGISNCLNTSPVTLAALAKECRAITDALERLHELSRTLEGGAESVRASNNGFVYSVSKDVHELRAALKRIKGPDRDSGIHLGEPQLVIVWNEAALKTFLGRLRIHQASLHTLLNTATRAGYNFQSDINRRRVIEPDIEVDEALRSLGRKFTAPNQRSAVLPRVSDSAEIQVLLDTLVPPAGVDYARSKDVANELHHAIEKCDENAVFQILLERADPNIMLAGSMLSPLHRAFDKKHMLIAAFLIVAGADVDEPTTDGDTALMRGIKCGFSEQFAILVLHMKARVNAIDNNGCSALHLSAASDVLEDETLPALLDAGAHINLVDYDGQTPLHVAIQNSRWSTATKLVHAGADLEVRLPDGKTALHLAIALRNQEFTQVLISRGANVDRKLREHTPLTMAISSRCTFITAALLDSGANPNLPSRNGNTPLLAATVTGQDETVRYLIAHGADPAAIQGRSGYSPMHMAAHKDKPHILRLLAESGAPVDVLDKAGETPLLIAAKLGNAQSLSRLINLGADTERVGPDGMSVLSHAVKMGDVDLVTALLERGAGMQMSCMLLSRGSKEYLVPEPQTSPIHVAAQHARDEILVRLVSYGASLESTIFPGRTPLSVAASHGHVSTVRLLLRLGANTHALTTHGDTLLFDASANLATLKILLQQGIDVNHQNDRGATALHYAALRGHIGGVKMLLERGARQYHANAVWDLWEDRDGAGGYRQGTPAGMAMQRGLNNVAELIEGWKFYER
ncbi:ankyrin repeat-containing domain protein [Fusarium tricinctum]|uniref:Ankyrin repeat-containing domain protein n=1 Tax=Fusarium tricinctum TaxID=61284 RepID=A0A8K0WHJ0_9HYPO|nr:ankyrin repeat-containing domain protein [Fusarium tricinctum]